jgi:hypothetical protein
MSKRPREEENSHLRATVAGTDALTEAEAGFLAEWFQRHVAMHTRSTALLLRSPVGNYIAGRYARTTVLRR